MADTIQQWLNSAGRYDLLSREEMNALALERDTYEKDSKEYLAVINKMCVHNLRLIANTVKKFTRKRTTFTMASEHAADLLQVGYYGLRRAAEKFDGHRNMAFSTYAMPWIRQAISRWSLSNEYLIYVPESTMREVVYRRVNGKPSGQSGTTDNVELLDAATKAIRCSSIDIPYGDAENESIVSFLGEDNRMIDRKPGETVDQQKKMRDLMAECGIEPKTQDLMNAYANRGNIIIAAAKIGMPVKQARKALKETTALLRSKIAEREEARAALVARRLGRA